MIEINLLPGSGKKARGAGVGAGLSSALSGFAGQIKDPYMIAAVASAVVSIAVVGTLWFGQREKESSLREMEQAAVNDSANFAAVILEKRRATATRDSVLRQVRLIQTIDDDRYLWPHILAEVSKSVPMYTWLTSIVFLTPAVSPAAAIPVDSAALRAALTRADSLAILSPRTDTTDRRPPIRFEIKGATVDVQAMTHMMRDLETSPWIQNVSIIDSKAAVDQVTTYNEFTLHAEFQRPDSAFVKRAPIRVPTR